MRKLTSIHSEIRNAFSKASLLFVPESKNEYKDNKRV